MAVRWLLPEFGEAETTGLRYGKTTLGSPKPSVIKGVTSGSQYTRTGEV